MSLHSWEPRPPPPGPPGCRGEANNGPCQAEPTLPPNQVTRGGGGDGEGDGAQQQLREPEDSRGAGRQGGNPLPSTWAWRHPQGHCGEKTPSPLSGTCWGPSGVLGAVRTSFE